MIVTRELYTVGERRYIDIDGKQYKVRWRYNRPMIHQNGLKTIFEYKEGDTIHFIYDIVKWEDESYRVLKSISD